LCLPFAPSPKRSEISGSAFETWRLFDRYPLSSIIRAVVPGRVTEVFVIQVIPILGIDVVRLRFRLRLVVEKFPVQQVIVFRLVDIVIIAHAATSRKNELV